MNTNTASLDRLHDIIAPAPVPWWPPAPGWYWVLAFAALVLLALLIRGFVRWQRNRYRREALAELARLEHRLSASGERAPVLLAVAELLKRTALTAFPRKHVATLTGAKWFEFLDRTGQSPAFGDGLGTAMENAVYDSRNAATLDEQKLQELLPAIRHWIRHHKNETEQKHAKPAKDQSSDKPSLPSLPSVQNPAVQKPC